jgi:(S)-ureidoglycine aminohydrolase
MKSILLSVAVIGIAAAAGLPIIRHHRVLPAEASARALTPGGSPIPVDTLTSGVREWDKGSVTPTASGESREIMQGSTHDLSVLDIRAITLRAGNQSSQPNGADSLDELLIVKEDSITIQSGDSVKGLGPGGVALFAAGQIHRVMVNGTEAATYYLFRFRSRSPEDRNRASQADGHYPFILDWAAMPVRHTAIGESRQIFSQPTSWLTKIDMHATTLNPGEVSHPPHIHRAEEIILMRSGHVQEYINGKHYPATAGDLIFLASGSLHAVENKGTERCEYFALQWQQ